MGRQASRCVECYYRDRDCQGPTWTCRGCKEKFCSETHWHINNAGEKNVVCFQCEQAEVKKAEQQSGERPAHCNLPARISVTHEKDGRTTTIKDELTGQEVRVAKDHMPSIRKMLIVLFDETAHARWLYERITNPDIGLDGKGLTVDDHNRLAETLTPPGVKPEEIADDYGQPLC